MTRPTPQPRPRGPADVKAFTQTLQRRLRFLRSRSLARAEARTPKRRIEGAVAFMPGGVDLGFLRARFDRFCFTNHSGAHFRYASIFTGPYHREQRASIRRSFLCLQRRGAFGEYVGQDLPPKCASRASAGRTDRIDAR